MYWLDSNDKVTAWSSENVVIPYVCPTDEKVHRYFIDFFIETTEGVFLVEVKPQKECLPPKTGRGKKRTLVESEVMKFAKNSAKWKAAEEYAQRMGYRFQVWDETTLKKLGVVLPQSSKST